MSNCEHEWVYEDAMLACNPPRQNRICKKCGITRHSEYIGRVDKYEFENVYNHFAQQRRLAPECDEHTWDSIGCDRFYKFYRCTMCPAIKHEIRKDVKYKIAIVGSRNFFNYNLVVESIKKNMPIELIEIVVSGGAKGADTLGEHFALEHNIPMKTFLPNWDAYGKKAGYLRNVDIVKNSDIIFAFWMNKSKGTKHSIDLARKLNKQLIVVEINE